MTTPPSNKTDPLGDAARAASELDHALRRVGILLPSLEGDWPAINGRPLVNLGRVNLETVSSLIRLVSTVTPGAASSNTGHDGGQAPPSAPTTGRP